MRLADKLEKFKEAMGQLERHLTSSRARENTLNATLLTLCPSSTDEVVVALRLGLTQAQARVVEVEVELENAKGGMEELISEIDAVAGEQKNKFVYLFFSLKILPYSFHLALKYFFL